MKIRLDTHARLSGKILLVTIFIGAAVGIVLASCLTLVKSQNQAVARSQAWNACIPVIEAGIEEAMAHVNNPNTTTLASLASSGWQQNGSVISRPLRPMGDGFYLVNITLTNWMQPLIVCTGYVRLPTVVASAQHSMLAAAGGTSVNGIQYIGRTVQVVARKQRRFVQAMVAKLTIDMKGNGIATDSYNSSNNLYSTGGMYDPAKAHDRGDVATISGLVNSLSVGNADIYGRIQTGPGGSVAIGNGVVGDMAWHASGTKGIQPGAYTDDLNISLPDVIGPSSSGTYTPGAGTVGGVSYKYVLGNTNFLGTTKYQLSALDLGSKEKMAVKGHAQLLVQGNVNIAGRVDILPGGTLEMYVAGTSANIGGQGVFNGTGQATNFVYYGLPTNFAVELPSNGDFTGLIYAPSADLNLSGGGSTLLHFSGACVMRSIKVNGHYKFHYDEALGEIGPLTQYVIVSWVEL